MYQVKVPKGIVSDGVPLRPSEVWPKDGLSLGGKFCQTRPLSLWADGSVRIMHVSTVSSKETEAEFEVFPTFGDYTQSWQPQPIDIEKTLSAGTNGYKWRVQKVQTIVSGLFEKIWEATGWLKNDEGQTWTACRTVIIERLIPGVWEVWFWHNNMQLGARQNGGISLKRGTLGIDKFIIEVPEESELWMPESWAIRYPEVTSKFICPMKDDFLEDAAGQIIRFWIKAPWSNYDFKAGWHITKPLMPLNPETIFSFYEHDGVLPPKRTDVPWPRNLEPHFSHNFVISRFQYLSQHTTGYPLMNPLLDLPQLYGYGDSYVDDLLRFAACNLERPVQRPAPHLETGELIPWEYDPSYSDRYNEGMVATHGLDNQPRPVPDYRAIKAAIDLRTHGAFNGLDKEHWTCPEEQAYYRTGIYWFAENIRQKAECVLSEPSYGEGDILPAWSERTSNYGIGGYLSAYKVTLGSERERYYRIAANILNRHLKDAGTLIVNKEPVPLVTPYKGQQYFLKVINGYAHGQGNNSSSWMLSQLLQRFVQLCNEEIMRVNFGFEKIVDLEDTRKAIVDTLKMLMWKYYVAPGEFYPPNPSESCTEPQGQSTNGGFYGKMTQYIETNHPCYPGDWIVKEGSPPAYSSTRVLIALALGSLLFWYRDALPVYLVKWMEEVLPKLLAERNVAGFYNFWYGASEQVYKKLLERTESDRKMDSR